MIHGNINENNNLTSVRQKLDRGYERELLVRLQLSHKFYNVDQGLTVVIR